MPIIVSDQILQKEFGSEIPEADTKALLRSARVTLTTPIASKGLPAKTRLLNLKTAVGINRRLS